MGTIDEMVALENELAGKKAMARKELISCKKGGIHSFRYQRSNGSYLCTACGVEIPKVVLKKYVD